MRSVEDQKKNPYTEAEVKEIYEKMSQEELAKEAYSLYLQMIDLTSTTDYLYQKGMELAVLLDEKEKSRIVKPV